MLSDLQELVGGLDPESVDPADSVELYEKFCRAERVCAAGKALVSRRVASSNAWHFTCHRSPAHLMASISGSTVGHAVRVLETAELLAKLPETEKAYRSGALSEVQIVEVVSAASLAPQFQDELLSSAECDALEELRRKCARVRAGVDAMTTPGCR